MKMKLTNRLDSKQAGASTIAVVMGLLIVGLMLMSGFNQLITSWQKSMLTEQRYYARFNQAYSSLNWATTIPWPTPTQAWQCQTEKVHQFKACIKNMSISTNGHTLVRGEFDNFYLYQIVNYTHFQLIVERGHWLDYCPDKRQSHCE